MLIARNLNRPGWTVTCGCGLNVVCLTLARARRIVRTHTHPSAPPAA